MNIYNKFILLLLFSLPSIELVKGINININNIKLNRNIPKLNIPKLKINEKINNSIQLCKDLLLISVLSILSIIIYISKNIYIIIIIIIIIILITPTEKINETNIFKISVNEFIEGT